MTSLLLLVGRTVYYQMVYFPCIFSDVNECHDNNGGCEQICCNTIGSFQCKCRHGFELSSDGKTCTGMFESFFVAKMQQK